MTRSEETLSLFERDEIKKIRKMAILVLDLLPEKRDEDGQVINDLANIDEYTDDGAIQIVKEAFEALDDEQLEEAGVNLDDFEEIREKMELIETVDFTTEYIDRDVEELSNRFRAEQRADL